MPMTDETPQTNGAAAIDLRYAGAHPRDVHMDGAGNELLAMLTAWRAKWQPTRVEYLWCVHQMAAMELRAYGKEERDRLDGTV